MIAVGVWLVYYSFVFASCGCVSVLPWHPHGLWGCVEAGFGVGGVFFRYSFWKVGLLCSDLHRSPRVSTISCLIMQKFSGVMCGELKRS